MNISRTVFYLVAVLTIAACAAPAFSQTPSNVHRGADQQLPPGLSEFAGVYLRGPGIPNGRLPFRLVDGKIVFHPESKQRPTVTVMSASAETVYAPLTEVRQRWDTNSSAWVNSTMVTYTYDGSGRLTNDLTQVWNVSSWLSSGQDNYTYDGSGNQTEAIYQYWSGTAWTNYDRATSAYDGSHRQTQYVYQTWSGTDWTYNFQYLYTYDGMGRDTASTRQTWNGSAWVNADKSTSAYDGMGRLSQTEMQTWNGSAWVYSQRSTGTYNVSGYLTSALTEVWAGTMWVNQRQNLYTYDGSGNITSFIYQFWSGTAWVNNLGFFYTWVGGNETEFIYETWNGSAWVGVYKYDYSYVGNVVTGYTFQTWNGSAWVNSDLYAYTYDGFGDRAQELHQVWNAGGSSWVNRDRTTTNWKQHILGVRDLAGTPSGFKLSDNYPNPFNPETKIVFAVPGERFVSLTIYDMLGREVAKLVQERKQRGEYSVTWNATERPSGVYYYRIVAGTFVQTKKMVLMK